jgi:hypothetical protein
VENRRRDGRSIGAGVSIMSKLADRIRTALANPLTDAVAINPMRELAAVLGEVGLDPNGSY